MRTFRFQTAWHPGCDHPSRGGIQAGDGRQGADPPQAALAAAAAEPTVRRQGFAPWNPAPRLPHAAGMNDLAPPPLLAFGRLLGDLQAFTRREPVQAMAMAVGAGLLVHLLPKRALVGAITTLAAAVLPPSLLALGLTKALELASREEGEQAVPPLPNACPATPQAAAEDTSSSRPSQWIQP